MFKPKRNKQVFITTPYSDIGYWIMLFFLHVMKFSIPLTINFYTYVAVNIISSKNTFGVKKAQPSKVESYLEVNT